MKHWADTVKLWLHGTQMDDPLTVSLPRGSNHSSQHYITDTTSCELYTSLWNISNIRREVQVWSVEGIEAQTKEASRRAEPHSGLWRHWPTPVPGSLCFSANGYCLCVNRVMWYLIPRGGFGRWCRSPEEYLQFPHPFRIARPMYMYLLQSVTSSR